MLAAFNAHDLDAVMSFFAPTACLRCCAARTRGAGGSKGGSRYASGSRAASPASRMSTTATTATGSPATAAAGVAPHRHECRGRGDRGARLPPVRVPQRRNQPQGLVLEDHRPTTMSSHSSPDIRCREDGPVASSRCSRPWEGTRSPRGHCLIGTPLEHIAGALWTSADFYGLGDLARLSNLQANRRIRRSDALDS
jgi:hypothetical protein